MMRWLQRLDDRLSAFGSTPFGFALLLAVISAIVGLAIFCPLPTFAGGAP